MWKVKSVIKNLNNSTDIIFYYLYLILSSSQNVKKDVQKRNTFREKGTDPIETFSVTRLQNKNSGRILHQTLLANKTTTRTARCKERSRPETTSYNDKKRLDGPFKPDCAEIVNKFSDIFGSSSGKCWTHPIETRNPQVRSGVFEKFPRGQGVGWNTLQTQKNPTMGRCQIRQKADVNLWQEIPSSLPTPRTAAMTSTRKIVDHTKTCWLVITSAWVHGHGWTS